MPPNLCIATQYTSINFVLLPHQSTSLTETLPDPPATVTVFPRQSGPIAARNLPQAAATIEPGG